MALTDKTIKVAKCPDDKKSKKLFDANGLYILINRTGSKLWRMRYKYAGKHQEMALGKYPQTSLSEARILVKEGRKLLDKGINPMNKRRKDKYEVITSKEKQFQTIALSWWEMKIEDWTEDYLKKVRGWLLKDCALITQKSIDDVRVSDIAKIMLSIKKAGKSKQASPILSILNRVFGFAMGKELTENNPAQNFPLKDFIGTLRPVKHRAAITEPLALKQLLHDIDNNTSGAFCTVEALKLVPSLFLRPIEVRSLKWCYVDFEANLITLPEEEMKKNRDHLVPISKQVRERLLKLREHTGYSQFLFPNQNDSSKYISKNVLTNRLRALGYAADIVSTHGFRSTASTILNENDWDDRFIEIQLSHLIGTSSSRPYNRALYLKQRTKMMQWWSDYLDNIILE